MVIFNLGLGTLEGVENAAIICTNGEFASRTGEGQFFSYNLVS